MGQYWDMFCIDNRLRTGHLGKLAEAFYTDPHMFEDKLVRRQPVIYSDPLTPPVALLELLPHLIKRRICAFLAAVDVDSLLCLILSVPHLAADGRAVLDSRMSWAGKRIITLGDYAENLPENLLTADEEKCLLNRDDCSSDVLDRKAFDEIYGVHTSDVYPRAFEQSFALVESRGTVNSHIPIEDLVCRFDPLPENAVLRNLTLKQYYRDNNPCRNRWSGRCRDGEINDNFGLGQVVLIMTCWSEDASTSFHAEWTEDDAHGEWAGHRLDIVACEKVPADWDDVTDAVTAKLMRLRDQPY